jgi:hypothetical protein
LHGETHLQILKPFKPNQTVVTTEEIVDLQDKKKSTFLFLESTMKDASTGEVLAKVLNSFFLRGIGGFGHSGNIKIPLHSVPDG